jgi:signal transduction histidine kinase
MKIRRWSLPRKTAFIVLLTVALGLPLVIVLHSVLATRELREMRLIFLRDRAGTIAARLETMPPERLAREQFDDLFEGEPALAALHVFDAADSAAGNGAVEAIRAGRELFRTEQLGAIFRAWIPIHSGTELRVAQVDLSASAPDFILVHARHNIIVASLSGAVLLLLSGFAIWSLNRAARLERRQMETERLAEVGRLSAVLAHEIRNPLGAIKGFAQLAREGLEGACAKPLDAIVRESRRLEALVNSLLLYARPLEPSMQVTSWPDLAADLASFAAQSIGERPIRFHTESEIAELRTDPDLLKQALLNLIRNSVEAIPSGREGSVRLQAAEHNGEVVISLEDDGPGLPPTVREKLFEPFVTTKASGTGLGLAIAKKVIETLGGSLSLEAAQPRGTRAELVFHGTNTDHR